MFPYPLRSHRGIPALGGTMNSCWRIALIGALLVLCAVAAASSSAQSSIAIIDLGTFPGGTASRAVDINDAGLAVGYSFLRGDRASHAFVWTVAGGMQDLGTLSGGSSAAVAVSESGHVVGESDGHAFLWTQAGGMVDLGTLGGSTSAAAAVNAAGQVVGESFTAEGTRHAFFWSPSQGMIDLGTLGALIGVDGQPLRGAISFASAVNDAGQVVGSSDSPSGHHAFLWTQAEGMIDLGTLPSCCLSSATAINQAGQIVGVSVAPGTPELHAFSWTKAGGMVDLGTLGGRRSSAVAVNGAGQVVGSSEVPRQDCRGFPHCAFLFGASHAFSWTPAGGMRDLGTLGFAATLGPDDIHSFATSINEEGHVAGYSRTTDASAARAFLWTEAGGLTDLGGLGGTISVALAINNAGQIAGMSHTRNDHEAHAVVWQTRGLPSTADDCKDGGWQAFGLFANQGDCVSFVATRGRNTAQ
jgi:probable HAF family extracellular repeat protein